MPNRSSACSMSRAGLWLLAVGAGVAAGGLLGGVSQELLRWLSLDHVYTDDRAILYAALRGGFLLGTTMGAAAVVGDRRPPSVLRLLTAYLLVLAGTAVTALAAGVLGLLLAKWGWISGSEPPLPMSRRFVFCDSLPTGLSLGAVFFSGVALLCLVRGRRAS